MPVANGGPTGSASLLKSDLGTFSPVGVTPGGRLYYRLRTFPRFTVKVASIDQTARTIGDAVDVDDDPVATTTSPGYSRNGKSIAYLKQQYSVAGELPAVTNRVTMFAVADRGAFKTPTLRDVALTAPYMHDGSLATLEDVVEFYDQGGRANPDLDPDIRPLRLTADDKGALVAFLRALTAIRHQRRQAAAPPAS